MKISLPALMRTAPLVAVFVLGCSRCRSERVEPSDASANDVVSIPPPPASSERPHEVLHGLWSGRPFVARAGIAVLRSTALVITIIDQPVNCTNPQTYASDMTLTVSIPAGPDQKYYVGHWISSPVDLRGAGGISRVPAGHVSLKLEEFEPETGRLVRGQLALRFRTANDLDAPAYDANGSFESVICSVERARESRPSLRPDPGPIRGHIADRPVQFLEVHVYERPDGYGGRILMFKAYREPVTCNTTRSLTPFLYGAEVGPGPNGDYYAGTTVPAEWVAQMRADGGGEKSVHVAAGTLQIQQMDLRPNGFVTGQMTAEGAEASEATQRVELGGSFRARLCGEQRTAW